VSIGIPLLSGERGRARAARASADEIAARTFGVAAEVRARARAVRMRALAAYDEARHRYTSAMITVAALRAGASPTSRLTSAPPSPISTPTSGAH
jgi:hypothetical protein